MLKLALQGKWDSIDPGDLIQHGSKLQRACDLMRASGEHPPRDKLYNFLYTGPTGVGKSCVLSLFPGIVYTKPEGKWWPNYRGQPLVYWEDVEPEDFTGNARMWKRILDHYVQQTETKGSHVYATPFVIYITSNYTFEELTHKLRPQDLPPLRRRLKCLEHAKCKDPTPSDRPYRDIVKHLVESPVSIYNIIKRALIDCKLPVPEIPEHLYKKD